MNVSKRSFWLVVLSLLPLLALGAVDWFESLDRDHDGSLSRQEYDQGMLKLKQALETGPLASTTTTTSSSSASKPWIDTGEGGFWKGFSSGVAMIIATEIGDKTFFIAAVLSMRHDRAAVFGGAIVALIIMTILSSVMGLVLPQFLPRQYTHILGGLLFLYFGIKLLLESRAMESHKVSEELEEVEEELLHTKKQDGEATKDDDEETPTQQPQQSQPSSSSSSASSPNKKSTWAEIFVQSLTLTFLAEWGDRSQIATIALSAAKNPYGVTVGGCLGHSLCTGMAVMGGRMLAARISEKTVTFWGGIIFLVFGFHSIFMEE